MSLHLAELGRREGAIDVFIESPERVFAGEAGGRSHERRTPGWGERFRLGRLWAMGYGLTEVNGCHRVDPSLSSG
jgi:hypothetical protein